MLTVRGTVPSETPNRPRVIELTVRFVDVVPVLKPCASHEVAYRLVEDPKYWLVPDAPRLPNTTSARALREQKVTAASVAATPRERMNNDFRVMRLFLSKKLRRPRAAEGKNDERQTNKRG
jgi:hypothetical protein